MKDLLWLSPLPGDHLALGFGRQNSGSAAIHSLVGMLQYGRTEKMLVSAPAARACALASVGVRASLTMYRVPSLSNTVPSVVRLPFVTVITKNRPAPTFHRVPRLRSGR